MDPIVRKSFACSGLTLGNLVLVMWELQILPTAVDIEMIAKAARGHRRTLDMPARPPIPPWGFPAWLARLRGFPQDKIQWVPLVFTYRNAFAGPQVFDTFTREFSLSLKLTDPVIDVTIVGQVGVIGVDQLLDRKSVV